MFERAFKNKSFLFYYSKRVFKRVFKNKSSTCQSKLVTPETNILSLLTKQLTYQAVKKSVAIVLWLRSLFAGKWHYSDPKYRFKVGELYLFPYAAPQKQSVRIIIHSWSVSNYVCPTLCNPMDCSLPCSSVHGILQARILEWVAFPISRGSSWPRDLSHCKHILYCVSHQESP